MPLSILRLNHAPSSHPNDHITFIKPLPRPPHLQADYTHADTFLRAIAAQCLPIMKTHHLSITTLEEHEPNREFIGRNFNNGEVVQLVLRRRRGGGGEGGEGGCWMSFRQVQMVMMHELAHNLQMNHGRGFWVERNRFVGEMMGLWGRGYTGDGFWGVGRELVRLEGHIGNGGAVDLGMGREVEGLCGGAFRSRGRKGKRKRRGGERDEEGRERKLTWKEQRDRRVEKKFGRNGVALGEDEDARIKLEIRKKGPLGGKPRVAASKRGRELRAAAALTRFEVKKEGDKVKGEEDVNTESHCTSEDDDPPEDELDAAEAEPAIDINGNRILDSMGFGMVRVCGEEDVDDVNLKQEMKDFDFLQTQPPLPSPQQAPDSTGEPEDSSKMPNSLANITTPSALTQADRDRSALYSIAQHQRSVTPPPSRPSSIPSGDPALKEPNIASTTSSSSPTTSNTTTHTCPICSTPNDPLNSTCTTCASVLDSRKDPRSWKFSTEACKGSKYVNAGDCGRCDGRR